MKILVTEARRGDAFTVGALLAAEGHTVAFCHPQGVEHLPCVGMADAYRCPLTLGQADVVVDVRIEGGSPNGREMGALCALHHDKPLVIAGTAPPESTLAQGALLAVPPDAVTAVCAGIHDGRRHSAASL